MSGALQTEIQAKIDDLIASGGEIGLQVAVSHEGCLVVDAVAGVADQRTGQPISPDTLFFAASTTKGIAASVAHVLVERGEIAYDHRVADSWPAFAAHGKDAVTLADVLTHTAGVPGLLAPDHSGGSL